MLLLERFRLVQPTLIATLVESVEWPPEDDNDDDDLGYDEDITYYLLEYPSGRRTYDWHAYGKAQEVDYYEVNLAPVLAWTYGGPLPSGAKLPKPAQADVVPFRVVKDTPPSA
ncbi:MAG: hypothetical protein EOP84_21650 [Verrucomicrobiaceae bacterium]|nr:MAG: hypothetical protein EOP84_21650 [Verrucomicrobiaceae bacterium]